MDLKSMGCPNCGANLKYNSKTRHYECDYCQSVFRDTKANASGDPRIELTPEDLEALAPKIEKVAKVGFTLAAIPTIIFVVIFIVVIIITGAVIVNIFDFASDTMDDMEGEFDDWPSSGGGSGTYPGTGGSGSWPGSGGSGTFPGNSGSWPGTGGYPGFGN